MNNRNTVGNRTLLVSSCLLGITCKHDGRSGSRLPADVTDGRTVHGCPEILGGLGTPRPRAEIVGGDGHDVLDGNARVVDESGKDVTQEYILGAERLLAFAERRNVKRAVLQDFSPACGVTQVSDGTFRRRRVEGAGVAAALLMRNGIAVDGWVD